MRKSLIVPRAVEQVNALSEDAYKLVDEAIVALHNGDPVNDCDEVIVISSGGQLYLKDAGDMRVIYDVHKEKDNVVILSVVSSESFITTPAYRKKKNKMIVSRDFLMGMAAGIFLSVAIAFAVM